ncbi:class I SAM-dependent methyltransferase [Sphingomonas faeni]|uniref:class I SAM-dependent methyltransferase n=1 Tax=Sphingomonas faeni TaxID=185950 RepID=UPI00335D26F3
MSCGFAWNAAFDLALLTYDEDYENNQSFSPAFERHLEQVATVIKDRVGHASDLNVVEIGCGQGYFLHRLQDLLGDRIGQLIGFDPAYRSDSVIPSGARVEQAYFNLESSHRVDANADVLVTRHTIEHIDDPMAFLRSIRAVAKEGCPIFVETPTIQWILDGAVAHDLYYEHCSIFDAECLRLALETAGFVVQDVQHVLDGQYLLATAYAGNPTPQHRATPVQNSGYPERRAEYVAHWADRIEKDGKDGERVALWGGASKGVTLALLLGEHAKAIDAAIDINPARSESFMAMSGIPVILPDKARQSGITKAYVMNPAYFAEIQDSCTDAEWPLKLVPVK